MRETRKEALASRLRSARERSEFTQREVAFALDWHRETLAEIEAGRRSVQALELVDLARQYGVTPASLLEGL